MSFASRLQYYRRIFSAYLLPGKSQLTFWHDEPQVNSDAMSESLGEYYMLFSQKADYAGPHDAAGIPMLDYRGKIGVQYNPIAIAQWGLGNHDLYHRTGAEDRKQKFLAASDWLCANLQPNSFGVHVWNHHFDWEYRTPLKAPWYSGLAQGQGISLLVRSYQQTKDGSYLEAAERAFVSFNKSVDQGGVLFADENHHVWFEEYIVTPPTHILNGFIWAAWGVLDYYLATKIDCAQQLFTATVETLKSNLEKFDAGFWSLYEQSGTRMPMVASPFYHRLHIVQLWIMHKLTGEAIFKTYAEKWEEYARHGGNRTRALCYKGAFKLLHY